ncbi:MAG: response regulator [Pseudomonadales bacterium]
MAVIFLVDDEPLVTRVVQRGLRKAGHEVRTFHDGHDVLEAVAEQQPDALVTDIEMPLMSGRELSETLCQRYPDRAFPIFIVTSAPDLSHREWSGALPKVHFLEKPVSMRDLRGQLAQALSLE